MEYYLDNNGDEHLYQTVIQNENQIKTKYNLKWILINSKNI